MSVQASPGLMLRNTPLPVFSANRGPASVGARPAVNQTIAAVASATQPAKFLGFERLVALVLLCAVVLSAVMLVWSRHQSRALLQQLEQLNVEHDELQIEWGRLQLEQATWSENSRVEQIAVEKLGLGFPEPARVVVIKQ